MIKLRKIFYWSPHINPQIATVKAVINSAKSLNLYGKKNEIVIINVFGEWDDFKNILNSFNIKLINLTKIRKKLPIEGFLKSRLFYIFVSIVSILKLKKLLKKEKPDFLISHLIVIPTLILSRFYKTNTKFILRISGLPNLNFFRKIAWRYFSNNIFAVTCPTLLTMDTLLENKLFKKQNIHLLRDPIFNMLDLPKRRKKKIFYKNYALAIGRLTYQKNFEFLIKNYSEVLKMIDYKKLIIIGSGENKNKLLNLIKLYDAEKYIEILDYQDNIDSFYKNADCFILTSRWEDPGFVLIEAAINNIPIISNDSPNGPKEFIKNEINGISYRNFNNDDFKSKLIYLLKNLNSAEIAKKKIAAKLYAKQYSLLNHYRVLNKILS